MNERFYFSRTVNTFRPAIFIGVVSMIVFLACRAALLLTLPGGDRPLTIFAESFFVGTLYDLITTGVLLIPLLLQLCFTNEFIYTRKGKNWVLAGSVVLFYVLLFTHIVPRDYSRDLYKGMIIYLFLRFAIYLVLLIAGHTFRVRWRRAMLFFTMGITIFALLFNAVSEYFFWNEFTARYNFIAVDYLVYTNEVIGNIRESYPLTLILCSIGVVTVVVLVLLKRHTQISEEKRLSFPFRISTAAGMIGLSIVLAIIIPPDWQYFSGNNYADELAGNGPYDFVQAFKKNELDFYKYYQTLPDQEAFRIVRQHLGNSYSHFDSSDNYSIERTIDYPGPERKMNVVLISVESFSATFMAAFGNEQHLTPYLDSIANKGLLFTNLYASGTRTVRGLEALSLSIPPLPGQSLVKRPGNENLFSLGGVFKSKGYNTQYIYGGYSYFDNMNYFFSHNNYEVIDRSAINPAAVHYANIWGVADEDLFALALQKIDSNDHAHQPFFSHIMTVSNHRPYTYPDQRIDIPPSTQTREGAVKYTDYCIGQFLHTAATKPWFNNTVFIIVADHCASSAGKTALPVTGYHIPMIIYSPANISPRKISTLTAQVDIAPTILGLLQMDYRSKFFGKDVLHEPAGEASAFISTYQGLGFLKNDTLVVQSPVKRSATVRPDFATGAATALPENTVLQKEATAFYQVAAWLIRHGKYTR